MLISKYTWRDAGLLFHPDGDSGAPVVPPVTPPSTDPAEEPFDPERAMATIKNLRGFEKQAKDLQKQLDTIKSAEDEKKNKELTEAQKATARAEKAEADAKALGERHRTSVIRAEIKLLAAKNGFVDPEDAVLNLANDPTIDLDENDKVTGAEAAVKALAKAKPHLLAATRLTAPNINATGGGNPPPVTPDTVVAQKRASGDYVPF